jgi:hypothetical protein
LAVPPGADGTKYLISLTTPLSQTITATFYQNLSSTPVLTLLTPSTFTSGTQTVQLSKSSATNPTNISIYNTLNPSNLYPVNWSYSGTTISLTYNFNAGAYGFKIWYDGIGWATCTAKLNIASSPARYTLATVNTISSYAGGFIIVSGSDISQEAVIKIGGFTGNLVSKTSTNATFALPPLVTPSVVAMYP